MADATRTGTSKKRGMGRGLAAILPRTDQPGGDALRHVALDLVGPNPDQPRRSFDEQALLTLSESIAARGLLQPIVVNPLPGGRFELVAGERRLRAAALAGLDRVPAIVRATEAGERLELALMENVAREDLNPVEEARACATLVDDLGVTKEELARRIGKSRVAVSNLIRLLALPDEVLGLLEGGELTEGHGRAILLSKDQHKRIELARAAVSEGWSVRHLERYARGEATSAPGSHRSGVVHVHPDLAEALGMAEDALTTALGLEVKLRAVAGGCRAEFNLDDPRSAIDLAERLMRRAAAA